MKQQNTIVVIGEANSLIDRDFKHLFKENITQLLTIDFKGVDTQAVDHVRYFAHRHGIKTFGLSIQHLFCKESFDGIEAMLSLSSCMIVFQDTVPAPQPVLLAICAAKSKSIPVEIIYVPKQRLRALFA